MRRKRFKSVNEKFLRKPNTSSTGQFIAFAGKKKKTALLEK